IPLSPPGADAAVHAAHRGCTRAALADAASRPRRLLQRLRGRRDRSTSTGSAFSPVGYGPVMSDGVTLGHAVETAATGDVWLFRGKSLADLAIRTVTNAPVNHVGMVVALDDLPPLLWHAELGRSLPDVWTGERQRGVQLHLLRDAVTTWNERYGQRAWVRQLEGTIERPHEDRLMETIARLDGKPFPTMPGLAREWAVSRVRRQSRSLETIYCAALVASTYQAMGLLSSARPPGWYDPGRFWSGDHIELAEPFRLGGEIRVQTG